ncbi:MAG: hypothetical protein KDA21_09575 [Phycisphaerales bacterium]|nr:hypothetical protein [Phycisphaerales bacterium]
MLTRITGRLESVEGNVATVAPLASVSGGDVMGMAYAVFTPAAFAERLAERPGSVVTLHTIEVIEQHGGGTSFSPRVIGFETRRDRAFFELFTTVKGVGPRKALRALVLPMAEVARAIFQRDATALRRMPEIGPRLAETIIAELHGKVDPFLEGPARAGSQVESSGRGTGSGLESGAARQAIEALVRLGEAPADARRKVEIVIKDQSGDLEADAILAATFGVS